MLLLGSGEELRDSPRATVFLVLVFFQLTSPAVKPQVKYLRGWKRTGRNGDWRGPAPFSSFFLCSFRGFEAARRATVGLQGKPHWGFLFVLEVLKSIARSAIVLDKAASLLRGGGWCYSLKLALLGSVERSCETERCSVEFMFFFSIVFFCWGFDFCCNKGPSCKESEVERLERCLLA